MAIVLIKYQDRDGDDFELEAEDGFGGGGLCVRHVVVESALPTGAATSAKQDDIIAAINDVETAIGGISGGGSFTYKVFQNTDIDAADEALGASETCVEVRVKNISTGGQKVYVIYASQGTATTSNGFELAPGEQEDFPGVTNVTDLHVISSAANAAVCYRTKNPA